MSPVVQGFKTQIFSVQLYVSAVCTLRWQRHVVVSLCRKHVSVTVNNMPVNHCYLEVGCGQLHCVCVWHVTSVIKLMLWPCAHITEDFCGGYN